MFFISPEERVSISSSSSPSSSVLFVQDFPPLSCPKTKTPHLEPLDAARHRRRVHRRRRHQLPPGQSVGRRPGPAGRGVPVEGLGPRRGVGARLGVGERADPLVDHAREAGRGVGLGRGVGALGAAAGEFLRGSVYFFFFGKKGRRKKSRG